MLTAADRTELADLVARYAARVDDRVPGVAELFCADAELIMPSPPERLDPSVVHTGRSEIATALVALDEFPVTQHAIVGMIFDDAGDGVARGRASCVAHHLSARPSGELGDIVWHLRYHDDYRKVGQAWLFARRAIHVDWIETNKPRLWRIEGRGTHR